MRQNQIKLTSSIVMSRLLLFSMVSVVWGLVGCSTLKHSQSDRLLRIQGTYFCPAEMIIPPKNQKNVKWDATIARCYMETATVFPTEVKWKRVFYSDRKCLDERLGFSEWVTPLVLIESENKNIIDSRYVLPEEGVLTRVSPEWFYEVNSECDLRKFPLSSAVRVSQKQNRNCLNFFPITTNKEGQLKFNNLEVNSSSQVQVETNEQKIFVCTRQSH